MATKTTNYGLTKPDQTDTYNIADFNTDMDTIDAELKKAIDTNIMSGATASQDGTQGLTPAPVHGQQNYVLAGSGAFKNLLSLLTSFVGATSTAAGTIGAVPAPAKGEQNKILTGAGTWQLISALLSAFTGATASAAGSSGIVPAPTAGQQNAVLTGGGSFQKLSALLSAFTGATSTAAGAMGAVPAPTAGQQSDLLTGAGTFQSLSSILAPLSLQNGAIYSCDFSNAPTSWWAKLGGAGVLIVQGGRVTSPSSTGNATTVTFPLAFPSALFGAFVTLNSSDRLIVTKTNLTKTGMNVNFFWSDGGNVSIASSADYIAVGN